MITDRNEKNRDRIRIVDLEGERGRESCGRTADKISAPSGNKAGNQKTMGSDPAVIKDSKRRDQTRQAYGLYCPGF